MSIKIRTKKLKDGFVTPYLEFNYNGERWYEFLQMLKYKDHPQSLADRMDTKEKKELVNRILRDKELQLVMSEYDIKPKYNNKIDFFDYLEEYIKNYANLGDFRAYKAMQKKLIEFVGKPKLFAYEIDEAFVRRFVRHLETKLNYETPTTYFKKLKKILKYATKQNIFKSNPADEVQTSRYKTHEKEILTIDEIKKLSETNCPNRKVKDSFLFSTFTGLRFVDVKKLLWKNIVGDTLSITQSKTRVPLTIPIHLSAIVFLGDRQSPDELVFNLPSHTACLKSIRKWVKDAKIDKHITYHSARHSLGSNLVANGVDISVTARILGHTSLKHTMRYVRTSETMKQNAINTLPIM